VVEVDGSPHRRQQGYDELRDSYLGRYGIRVLRLPNELIRRDLQAAICAIRNNLHLLP
jgi:very-short-patch-repair endonuclease